MFRKTILLILLSFICYSAKSQNIILGRPTDNSITISILFAETSEFIIEYGTITGVYQYNSINYQAEQIKRRLFITDAVHSAEYSFQIFHGQCYWLFVNTKTNIVSLSINGPNDWSFGAPESYEYISRVRYMGDSTWIEVDENGNLL